jgi:hypothetical protein
MRYCLSFDGTYLKYRRRRRAGEHDTARDERGPGEIATWQTWLDSNPALWDFESPSLPVHKRAAS